MLVINQGILTPCVNRSRENEPQALYHIHAPRVMSVSVQSGGRRVVLL